MEEKIPYHEIANIFPMMNRFEFDNLKKDIRENGLLEPIWLHQNGSILDGRNRYEACTETGTIPRFRIYEGDDPLSFVVGLNLHRRHLHDSQRAMVAAKIANMRQGQRNDLEPCSNLGKVSQTQAAELMNVSRGSLQSAKKVHENGTQELVTAVEGGEVSVSAAAMVAELPPQDQIVLVSNGKGAIVEAAKQIKENKKTPHVCHNSGNNEWYTPEEIAEAARATMGEINLDPASSAMANTVIKANDFLTVEDDGLSREWYGNVWLNPPYSSDLIGKFCEKIHKEYMSNRVSSACVLVNNATETQWFRLLVSIADGICFPASRIKFRKPDGEIGQPLQGQAILYIGDDLDSFVREFSPIGFVVEVLNG